MRGTGIDPSTIPTVRHIIATEAGSVDTELIFDDLLAAEPLDTVEVAADALALLIFTSGTAGSPRAAMLSHGNLLANIDQGRSTAAQINADDVVYGVLPMFHIFGLNVVLGFSLANGATVVLVQRFDPSTALDTIRERGITVIPGAPPLWLAFSHFDAAPADSFATVRLALTGAAKMPEEAIRRLQDQFGDRTGRGIRAHRGVACGHELRRVADQGRLGGQGARRHHGQARRRGRRRRATRRRR